MIRSHALLGGIGTRFLPIAAVLITLFSPPAAAQEIRDIVIDLSSAIERYAPPLRRLPTVGITITPTPFEQSDEELAKVRFVLSAVRLEGDVMFEPGLFAPLWTDLIGRKISLLDMRRLLHEIEQTYKKHDYYMLAVMAPGDFRSGVVRIVIYESYIEEVVIEGNLPHAKRRLKPFIDKIVAMRPVRVSKIVRYLLLISDLAGIELDASFSKIPGRPGAAYLVLNIDFTRRVLRSHIDNYGARDTGPMELSADGQFNDVFRLFEWSRAVGATNPIIPKELVLFGLSQHVPFGPSGFASGYDYAHASTDQTLNPGGLSLYAETTKAQVYVDYALLRSLDRNVITHLAIRGKEVDIDIAGIPIREDRKRWIAPGATYSDTFAGASLLTEMALAHGIDGLDTTGFDNDYSFATIRGHLSRDISKKVGMNLLFAAQYAFTELPRILNFDLGGEDYARAFDFAAISGQDGVAATFEVGRDIDTRIKWVNSLTLFGFVDYGAVWNPPGRWDYTHASLGSIGFGIRTRLHKHVLATGYVAVPYKDEPEFGAKGTKIRFNAGLRF